MYLVYDPIIHTKKTILDTPHYENALKLFRVIAFNDRKHKISIFSHVYFHDCYKPVTMKINTENIFKGKTCWILLVPKCSIQCLVLQKGICRFELLCSRYICYAKCLYY